MLLGERVETTEDDGDRAELTAIAAGDRNAFERLYQRHGPAARSFLGRHLRDEQLADEALQDTFLAVWRGAGRFEGRSAVRTWIFAIARRQAWGKLRKEAPTEDDGLDGGRLGVDDVDPADVVLAATSRHDLGVAIGRLPAHQREVVLLLFGHDLSMAEAAEVLDVAVGTVKSRLNRARTTLAALLSDDDTPEVDR